MSSIEGGEEGAYQLMHNDAHDIDEFSDDVDSVFSDDSGPWGGEAGPFGEDGMAETHFDNEEDSIAFQGIPRYYYRHIRVLKRRNRADFEYDFDNVLNDAGRERLGIILATRSMYLSSLVVKVQNEHSFRLIFHGPFQPYRFLAHFGFYGNDDIKLSLPLVDLTRLFQHIQIAPTLTHLSLGDLKLDVDGIDLLASSLHELRLQKLVFLNLYVEYDALKDVLVSLDSSTIRYMYIVDCMVGRETCEVVANRILRDENTLLKVINFSCNNSLDDDCVRILCEAIRTNTKLKSLNVSSSNGVTDDCWGAIQKLVLDNTSIQQIYQSNHSIQNLCVEITGELFFYLEEILLINRDHAETESDSQDHAETEPDSQTLKLRGYNKITKYLLLGGESNMEIMDEFELSLMPHVLAFFSKKCPALHVLGTETVLFNILRHWKMPTLYRFLPPVKVRCLTQVDEPETKMPKRRKLKQV